MHRLLLDRHAVGAAIVPVPEQGPSVAVKVVHESIVPVNDEQGYGFTHPVVPFQTQVDNQALHSKSL